MEDRRGAVRTVVAAAVTGVLMFTVGHATRNTRPISAPAGAEPRLVEGVPVGYPQTPEGAVAAAVNLSEAVGSLRAMGPDRAKVLDQAVAPAARAQQEQLVSQVAAWTEETFGSLAEVVTGGAPLRVGLASYTPERAQVRIWRATAAAGPKQQFGLERWGTDLVTVVWVDGDWKYEGVTSTPGPTPAQDPDSVATESPQFRDALKGLEGLRHAPLR